ncbi:GvpL/GvpF family gas vesicle protein [Pseudonocardia zijingensis]|jgi:hypothetical protein|uniref:GvpL/GvpF family gas vesicle protein n=1 Tax=Pseudonocardia zijingensis TaxID=153376 RepID=UPI003621A49A
MAEPLVYLYAVTDARAQEPDVGHGVDGAPVRRVVEDGLAAVVSSVAADRFGEEPLKHNLEDLRWLEDTARAHHGVVDAVAQAGPVAPVRLATVYLDDDRVRGLLTERRAAFTAALDRVRGRVEWGVKGFAEPSATQPVPEPTDGAGPGASYLARRLAERKRAESGLEAAHAAADAAHQALAAAALASRRYPPQDPRLSGRSEEMVLNAAYLVEDEEALRQAVEEQTRDGLRLELTGPWAPYSFAGLEEP